MLISFVTLALDVRISINPDAVIMIEEFSEEATRIHFMAEGDGVLVKGDYEEVQNRLNGPTPGW